jgi:DNA-directed RNA polymerase specialized sigma24 family protein
VFWEEGTGKFYRRKGDISPEKGTLNKRHAMEVLETTAGTCRRADTEKSIAELYELTFPAVARLVARMGGSFPDAKDIFHDALVIYYEKQMHHTLAVTLSAEAYLLGIAKHLWLRKFRQDKGRVAFGPEELQIAIPPQELPKEDQGLLALLQLTGRRCLELLRAFYYDRRGLPDIARAFGYRTVRSATVQKYKCLEKVREKVKEKAVTYEDFLE